ncbi:hypothetical protein B0O80DRAFT_499247 [Mortierella sp. GBAus27b]|nr:hypothetical protein B0O80DRAFT_499247 [Mortierella sp. GBAus27b]
MSPEKHCSSLGALPGVELKCVVARQDDERAHLTDTRVIRMNTLPPETVFMALLKRGQATFVTRKLEMEKGGLKDAPAMKVEKDCPDFIDHIKPWKPAVIPSCDSCYWTTIWMDLDTF